MPAVLITQCLQRDFVGSLEAHDALPNKLHVGYREARRLLGPEPGAGPLAQMVHWAREQPDELLELVHIRDWHDPDDPTQADHLAHFGPHCLAGTRGARMVLDLEEIGAGEHLVGSTTLNDFEGTNLSEVLDELRPTRVGVIGVWTEAKVTFLLYELLTRCGLTQLATCSALTASASRAQHFNALEQLRKVLGVEVFDSVGAFAEWLCPEAGPLAPPTPTDRGTAPRIHDGAGTPIPLANADRDLVAYLYSDAARVEAVPLSGGFSGAEVYRVRSFDALGHEQAPTVLKLGDRELVAKERVAFERVEAILGNHAPSIRGFADLADRAGLKYAYAAMGSGGVRTLKSVYESGAEPERITAVLDTVIEEILGRFYAASTFERLPLLDYYTFDNRYAAGVRKRVAEIAGIAEDAAFVTRPDGTDAVHVAAFYECDLEALAASLPTFQRVSYVHGDLNYANMLLDGRDNVWVIDFFHAHRGHVLKDLAKLESDLLYLLTPVDTEEDLFEAVALTDALRDVDDLAAPLGPPPSTLTRPQFIRTWRVLQGLRRHGASLCDEARDPVQLDIALLRYAVHTLWFDEASPMQKRWALLASCGLAQDVQQAAASNRRLRVDWVGAELFGLGTGRLGLTICPGRRDRRRDLDEDLDALVQAKATDLLCLVTDPELAWLGVPHIGEAASAKGLDYDRLPIQDQGVPTLPDMHALIQRLCTAMAAGRQVVVHCMGGLGRSGTVAACALVARGHTPVDAIAAVRRARSPRAVETRAQEAFVTDYAAYIGATTS